MSQAVRRAIYGKLATAAAPLEARWPDGPFYDQDGIALPYLPPAPAGYQHSIYHQRAPKGAQFPFVIFQKQTGSPIWAMAEKAFDDEEWIVKAIWRIPDDGVGTADVADAIAAWIDGLLNFNADDSPLLISGKQMRYMRQVGVIEYPESIEGESFVHSGATYRLVYE